MSPQASPNNFTEFWQDFLRQSSAFWSQATTAPPPPDPSHAWQQFVTMWTACWTKAFTLSPDTIQTSQKLWMDQLETISQGFAKVMGTDTFAAMQGQFFEQQLSWQDHLTKTIQPQTDAALRALNLPSRNQMDRLFERIVNIEERLDDVETDTRLIRRALRHGNDAAPVADPPPARARNRNAPEGEGAESSCMTR